MTVFTIAFEPSIVSDYRTPTTDSPFCTIGRFLLSLADGTIYGYYRVLDDWDCYWFVCWPVLGDRHTWDFISWDGYSTTFEVWNSCNPSPTIVIRSSTANTNEDVGFTGSVASLAVFSGTVRFHPLHISSDLC